MKTIALSYGARAAFVPQPDPRARAGVASLPELLSTYGIYIVLVAFALAAAAVVLIGVGQSNTVQEVQSVVSEVQDLYRNNRGSDKTGLTTALIGQSGRLPTDLVENNGTEIWVGGGDFPVRLLPGDTTAFGEHDKLLVNGVRFFSVLIGDDANPLGAELCADIVLAQYTDLVAIGIVDAADQSTPTLDTFSGTVGPATHWSIRGTAGAGAGTPELLDDLSPADVELACTSTGGTAITPQVMLVFR